MSRLARVSRRLVPFTTLALLAGLVPIPVAAHPGADEGITHIHDVQGSGTSSPLAASVVTVEAVIVGDFQGDAALNGFFLQEEDTDIDADPTTSEGIFVLDEDFGVPVAPGDVVRVTGTVAEEGDPADGTLTQIQAVTAVTVVEAGTGVATPAVLAIPADDARREAVEGMAVTLANMYVTDTFNLHRFGEVWLASGGVIEQPTNELPPGPAADALATGNMLRAILLDDGSDDSNPSPIPYLHANGTLRVGDRTNAISAVMSFDDQYRLHPTAPVDFDETNPRPAVPNVGGDLQVASFNVLNYWTTIGCGRECRGAQTQAQLDVQTAKLVATIRGMGAEIVGLQEIENLPGTDSSNPDDSTHTPIKTLVAALNAAEGSEVWAWVGPADHYNDYPIRNEIIYRIGAVTPVGDPDALAHASFDADNPLSGDPYGRPPLAQTFNANGHVFTVIVNHLKSKGTPCGEPNEGADGQGNCNDKRVEQANALLDFVDQYRAVDPDVLVIGDMNAYMQEDPIHTLETELVNLVQLYDPDPYSYNFFAMFAAPFIGRGSLDHAFATTSLTANVTGTATWHINADEPRFLDWFNPATSAPGVWRSSDHDPVLVGIRAAVAGSQATPSPTPAARALPNTNVETVGDQAPGGVLLGLLAVSALGCLVVARWGRRSPSR